MAFWDSFKDVLSGIGSFYAGGFSGIGKGLQNQFGSYGPGSAPGIAKVGTQIGASRVGSQLEIATGTKLPEKIKEELTQYAQEQAEKTTAAYDPLLIAAKYAEENLFSPYIKRPVSTAFLLTDPTSPLYENGPYGKGLQISDIQDAYNRSENVSLGVALTKSYLNPFHITGIQDAILENGGVDIDRVNLWNDDDVQKNFVENTTGRWMTGLTDAVFGTALVVAALSRSAGAVSKAASKAGLSSKINVYDVNTMTKLEKLADDHISGRTNTVFGSDIQKIADSEDIVEIATVLRPHTNNPRIPALAAESKDPAFIRDLILADKGYAPAIGRLMEARKADDLWYASNAAGEVSADFATTGKYRSYNTETKERWSQAFDDAIAKNPDSERIFNAFMRDEFDPVTGKFLPEPRVLGTTYTPIEPIIGKTAVIKARGLAQDIKSATVVRDYSKVGGIVTTLIGSGTRGGAATALIHFTGSKLPRGIVSHSGLRPADAVEEINAWLDDIPLFRRGNNPVTKANGTTVSAREYRTQLIDDFFKLDTDLKRAAFFKGMNEDVSVDILISMGLSKEQAVSFVKEVTESITSYHGDIVRDSFAMDPSGVRVVVNPQTQRQLANATPLIPMGRIVKEASKADGSFSRTKNIFSVGGRGLFEAGNRIFSFAQLVRPAYIPKNSIFEPFLAALMSQGSVFISESVENLVRNAIYNNKKRFDTLVEKSDIASSARKRAVVEEYGEYTKQYDKAVNIVDNATAEWVDFFMNPNARSPVTRKDYSDIVKADLRAAERLVANLEDKMRVRAREFGLKREEVPTLYGLVRRTQYLKSLKDPRIASDIANANAAITKAAGDINTLAPDLNKLNADIKTAYDNIDRILVEMGPARKALADEWSVVDNNRIRRRGSQEEVGYVMSNGQVIKVPRLEDERHLGTAYKAEISNRTTRELEILGDKQFATRTQMLGRRTPRGITDVSNPIYFDELEYVVNNYMRGDVLVDQILAGRSRDEIIQTWGLTRGGRAYANEFGRDPSEIIDIIDDQIAYVNRYLPTVESKTYAASGNVRGNRLAQLLGDKLEQLRPINPLDNKYATPLSQSKDFLQAIDRATGKAWSTLSAPENGIRWAWGSVEHKKRTIEKLELLASQGYEINTGTINSVRQAAAIEMVKEAEKVFYSIRRQNRALYAARTILSFPAAAASGIYRYTRFAAKSPQRVAGFLNSYYGLYNSFGVDQYGNPVEDPLDARFLIVPGTKELGLRSGQGLIVGARATNFLVNFPGPSYAVPIAVGQVLAMKPGNDKMIQETIDRAFGKLPGYSYKDLFPYGVETDLGKAASQAFTPGWARNLALYFNGDESKRDWLDSYLSEWNYQMALYEMGVADAPTEESVRKKAKNKYGEKAFWQFMSPLGSAPIVDMRPDNIFSSYFRFAADKYKAQGMTDREAKVAAENELNSHIMPLTGGKKFPLERLNYGAKAKPKATYVVPTAEGYSRVWEEFSSLANKLGLQDKNLIGLITSDLQGSEYDPNIARILNKPGTTLPDGTVLNLPFKSVADVERNIEVSRVWKKYSEYKDYLNKVAKDGDYASYASVPELRELLQKYAKDLGAVSPSWFFEYNERESKDIAYKYAWGLSQIVNNKKFMQKHGNTQYWTQVRSFLKHRQDFVDFYNDVPVGSKTKVVDAWQQYIASILDVADPKLANLLDRYFEKDTLRGVELD